MKITDLEIDGFGVWNDLKIADLSRQTTVFYGPNEAGKTTVMQFMRSVLYGMTASRRKRYLPPVDGGEPGGVLGIVEGELPFRAARYARVGSDDLGRLTCTTPDGVVGGERLLKEALGDVDEQTFTNVFAVTLSEMQELGTLSGSRAAEWLYRLTSGLDRVSLHDVMQQLREQRGSLLAPAGQPSRIADLSARRDKLRSEIDQYRDQYRQWSQLAVRTRELDDEIAKVQARVREAEHEARTAEIAVSLKPNWLKREKMDEQLVHLSGRVRLPDDAVERLTALNADVERHQREADVLRGQRRQLREEAERLGVNKLLVRNAGRIDALGEQRDWLAALLRQQDDLEREARQFESRLESEQRRLAEVLGLTRVDHLSQLAESDLDELRPHIDAVRAAQKRLDQAQRDADSFLETERTLKTQIESAIVGGESHGLPMDLQEASDLVAQLRKRLAIEQRLEQGRQHEADLEHQSHELLDDQVMPLWLFGWLLATFVLGALMLGVWALVPNSPFGRYGGLVALTGAGGAAVAWVIKFFAEDAAADRLDACQRQMEVVVKQIEDAEREKQAADAEFPMTDGSVLLRMQAAERHLAELESVLPVEAQRKVAGSEAQNADARLRQAQRERDAAQAQWKTAIKAWGFPESLDPQQLLSVTDRFAQLGELESRARQRREDAETRRREHAALCRRIGHLAEEVGCKLAESAPSREQDGKERTARLREQRSESESHDGPRIRHASGAQTERASQREPQRRRDDDDGEESNSRLTADERRARREGVEQRSEARRKLKDRQDRPEKRPQRDLRSTLLGDDRADSADRTDDIRREDRDRRDERETAEVRQPRRRRDESYETGPDPLAQLDHLLAERRRQSGAVERRAELREKGRKLRAEEAKHRQAIKAVQRRRAALFQGAGCDDEQQYRMLAADQHQAAMLTQQRDAVGREIVAAIGRHEPEAVFRDLLAPESRGSLDQLWEQANQELDALQAQLKNLAQERGELLREQAVLAEDRSLAERQLDLGVVERQLDEARQSWREHAVVGRVLERIRADYEAHRQPETLAEASKYLAELTAGGYRRIWTPLAGDCLLVDTADGQSLPVDVLSRGTREQLFLSVRLALVANFARRGVNLPMVLDDVLVNFDLQRTKKAAAVLCQFAAAGHQLLVFTCHEHMWQIFRDCGADCRKLPARRGRYVAPETVAPTPAPIEATPVVEPQAASRPAPPRRKKARRRPPVRPPQSEWFDYPFVEHVVSEPIASPAVAPRFDEHPAFLEYAFEEVAAPTPELPASVSPLAYIMAEEEAGRFAAEPYAGEPLDGAPDDDALFAGRAPRTARDHLAYRRA